MSHLISFLLFYNVFLIGLIYESFTHLICLNVAPMTAENVWSSEILILILKCNLKTH